MAPRPTPPLSSAPLLLSLCLHYPNLPSAPYTHYPPLPPPPPLPYSSLTQPHQQVPLRLHLLHVVTTRQGPLRLHPCTSLESTLLRVPFGAQHSSSHIGHASTTPRLASSVRSRDARRFQQLCLFVGHKKWPDYNGIIAYSICIYIYIYIILYFVIC